MHDPTDIGAATTTSPVASGAHAHARQAPRLIRVGGRVQATVASGATLDLANLIPAMAHLAMESRDPVACLTTSLSGLAIPLTAEERSCLLDSAMLALESLLDEELPE